MHYFQFRLSYKPEIKLVPIYLACSDLPLKFRLAPADGKYLYRAMYEFYCLPYPIYRSFRDGEY